MPFHRISRPRRGHLKWRAALGSLHLKRSRTPVWPILLIWAALCALLAVLPAWWLADWSERAENRWFAEATSQAERLTQEWCHWTVPVPNFNTGSEAAVQEWLQKETLITALVDPVEGRVWIREKDHLRLARSEKEWRQPAEWSRKAMQVSPVWSSAERTDGVPRAHRMDEMNESDAGSWWLVSGMNPHMTTECAIVTFFGKWNIIKRWEPGSPEVEQWLQSNARPGEVYRFSVISLFELRRLNLPPRALSSYAFGTVRDAHMGRTVANLNDAPYRLAEVLRSDFGDHWLVVLQMTPEVLRELQHGYRIRLLLVWAAYGIAVALSGLALSLFLYSQSQERLQADRLATLAHSLKTPLAILKLRCDTALNNDLPRVVQERQLLEIRNETDQLVHTIESGLEAMRTTLAHPHLDQVDGAFFEKLDDQYNPAFEAQGRFLEVYGSDSFRCCASALDSALATLIENALAHGKGTVVVKATTCPHETRIQVSDEGEGLREETIQSLHSADGLSATAVEATGKGRGMGLTFLVQLAKREGWGLSFQSDEAGFSASLEIPAQLL